MSFNNLPPVFILSTHLQTEQLHEAEDHLCRLGGKLTYQATEARIFLGRIKYKKRAAFELRSNGVWTEEAASLPSCTTDFKRRKGDDASSPLTLSDTDTDRESEAKEADTKQHATRAGQKRKREDETDELWPDLTKHVIVLRLDWLDECVSQNKLLPFNSFLVYGGQITFKPSNESPSTPTTNRITYIKATLDDGSSQARSYLTNSQFQSSSPTSEGSKTVISNSASVPFHRRKFGRQSSNAKYTSGVPKLHRTTTSEFEEAANTNLPPAPIWLTEPHPRPLYSCLRSTPLENPNKHFIAQLTKIKTARLLTLDEIGVRAYSTSIAALSAYPYHITSSAEITRLPGCDQKIAALWFEWRESVTSSSFSSPSPDHTRGVIKQGNDQKGKGKVVDNNDDERDIDNNNDSSLDHLRTIPVVRELAQDKDLQALNLFHEIWGVGPETARKFYYQCGFQDLDDLIEYHWDSLTRVQQIGVKFYDEFQVQIPRDEVESIAKVILQSARRARDVPERYWSHQISMNEHREAAHTGKSSSNTARLNDDDFDKHTNTNTSTPIWPWQDPHGIHTHPQDFVLVIVGGHRRGKATSGDVDVILSHRDEHMTQDLIVDVVHQLENEGYITHTLTLHTTTSDRGGATLPFRDRNHAGHGFDSLDKALVVWQDPNFQHNNTNGGKNPNIHRRVDIIISPWKTIGCAIMGWSGGTTFQRDVRRYVKKEKGWKFDSSGVRDRRNGLVLELEDKLLDGDGEEEESGSRNENRNRSDGWEDRERRLMENLGVDWREPWLRCTG